MKKNNLWKLAGALALTAVLAGCSSSISQEEATTIALEHAGVAKEDAVSLSVQQEYEDGRDIFEVKFSTQDTEYSYDVAQKDGEIINYNYDSTGTPPAGASEGSSASGTEAQAVQEEIDKAQQDQSAAESQAQAVEDAIDQATAENIALEHAGVTECYMHRVELDTEDGREVYEIEFFSGNTEYDYTVARDTGERQRPAERPGEQHLFHGGRAHHPGGSGAAGAGPGARGLLRGCAHPAGGRGRPPGLRGRGDMQPRRARV